MRDPALVAVCSRSFSRDPTLRARLLERYARVRFHDGPGDLSGTALVDFLRGAERAIVSLQRIDGPLLDQVPGLRVVSKFGVGLDGIDLPALAARGVRLGWTGGVNRRAVAELVLALTISLLRGVHRCDRELREGRWRQVPGRELGAVTLGVIGCGHIGKEVVRLVRPFGTRVLAHDLLDFPDFYREYQVQAVGLEALLRRSDVVSLHVPLDASTARLLDRERLGWMRPDACLVNTARGGLVDEQALAEALLAGRLHGAALDVFEVEPPFGSPLLGLPGFLATSHIGGSSESGILAMGLAAIDGLSTTGLSTAGLPTP